MDIAALTSSTTAATSSATTSSVISSDFETFLQMMTTQARYQDPLEPMDSSEYASQLAQFSMVEQQVRTNELLAVLGGSLGTSNMATLSGWIGMDALTYSPAHFDGAPVTVSPNPLAAADEVYLVVYDENGTEVQRQSVPVSPDPIQWAGVQDDGTPFETGNYTFELENYTNGELMLAERSQTFGRITEARIENGNTVLVLEGGMAVLSTDVTGLREGS